MSLSRIPESITFAGHTLAFERPVIMGILNVTPDSFSDGGRYNSFDAACRRADEMMRDGADIIDIGGESTRPGAAAVSVDEELDRTAALVSRLVEQGARISVDTSKPRVMDASIQAGAFMINDVRALREPGALEVVSSSGVPVCLMHMRGEPRTMQQAPRYANVVVDVAEFLERRAAECVSAGISQRNIVIDPGFGFGKTAEHNLCLLNKLKTLVQLGFPVLIGLSRKSLFADIMGLAVENRVYASVAAALLGIERGARIVRVHDVKATADAVGVYNAMCSVEDE